MWHLTPYMKKYRKEILLGPLFKFFEAVLELLLPLFLAKMIDNGLNVHNPKETFKMIAIMTLVSIVGLCSALVCQYYASIASQGFGTEVRNALMHKINHFSYAQLDQFGTESLTTRLTNDVTQVQTALAMFIRLFVRAPFLSIGSIVMAFYLDRQMGFIFLLLLPLFTLILLFILTVTIPMYRRAQQYLDHFNDQLSQNLTGIRVIRAFAKQKEMKQSVLHTSLTLTKQYERVGKISALLSPLTTMILNGGILTIFYVGAKRVDQGLLLQGNVLALINYMSQMLLALIIVSNIFVLFARAEASAKRIDQVLKSTSPLTKGDQTIDLSFSGPLLSFEDVSFRYPNQSGYALHHLSFSLSKGETLGVLGATGSGKSSLLPLLLHEYEPTLGKIFLFGKPVQTLVSHDIKKTIALVPQKAELFSGTIYDNLRFGHSCPSKKECMEALRIAQLHEFILNQPKGLDTPVLEGGKNFSGGEKQRLTIARALMKKAPLLLLDDSLSALDYQTDFLLRQQLKTSFPTLTMLLISQRISTLQQADRILVLHEGRQVGLGTHEELLRSCETYQHFYYSQQEEKA